MYKIVAIAVIVFSIISLKQYLANDNLKDYCAAKKTKEEQVKEKLYFDEQVIIWHNAYEIMEDQYLQCQRELSKFHNVLRETK